MALATGSQIGKYVLGRKLGHGGFGIVFAAHDSSLDREVALKFLKPEYTRDPAVVKRFLQEARAAAKIVHPGIVTVYECGEVDGTSTTADGTAFIAMELLEGESLTDRLARAGRLPADVVMELGRQAASALEAAHRAGIVHRDLKPDNLFLIPDPMVAGGERVKILDFGIAKLVRAPGSGAQTETMMVFGTPRYMSPEQCKSSASVDQRSDVYTLGTILFELVSGQPPFLGVPGELIAQHLLVAPKFLITLVPEAPHALAKLIDQMLQKEPDNRPPTMAAVQRGLEACGAVVPGVPATQPPTQPPAQTAQPKASSGPQARIPEVTVPPTAALATPTPTLSANETTTLSSMAHSRLQPHTGAPPRRRSNPAMYALVALLVFIPLVVYLATRSNSGDDDATVTAADPQPMPEGETVKLEPTPTATPAPAPAPIAREPEAAAPTVVDKPSKRRKREPKSSVADAPKLIEPNGRIIVPGAAGPPPPPAVGRIAISSRPACDVYVDGKQLGNGVSHRELELAPGRHRITLINFEHAIKDTFDVEIRAGSVERVAKDYTVQIERRKERDAAKPTDKRDVTINPFEKAKP